MSRTIERATRNESVESAPSSSSSSSSSALDPAARRILVTPVRFHSHRFAILATLLIVTLYIIISTRSYIFPRRVTTSTFSYASPLASPSIPSPSSSSSSFPLTRDLYSQCAPLWRFSVGFGITIGIALLPDLFAWLIQPHLLNMYPFETIPAVPLRTSVYIPAWFTEYRLWRAIQTAFGVAMLLCGSLSLLASSLIIVTTTCHVSEAILLWSLLILTPTCLICIGLRSGLDHRSGRLSNVSQGYIGLSCLIPIVTEYLTSNRDGDGAADVPTSMLVQFIRRWTRVNIVVALVTTIVLMAACGVDYNERRRKRNQTQHTQANIDHEAKKKQ